MTEPSVPLGQRINERAHLRGTFRLRSGATSDEYFDKYRFESDPQLLDEIARSLLALVPAGTEGLAGLELGGVPLATALSLRSGIPARFVRKQAKSYGTGRLAEGGEVAGQRLVIVEDVVTSGGQVVSSCQQLRALGAEIEVALCVIDRQAGGADALAGAGLQLRALFTQDELTSAATGDRASTLRSAVDLDRP